MAYMKWVMALILSGIAWAQGGRVALPVIDILYPDPNGSILDGACGGLLKTTVKPERVQEAVRRVPELQALWDQEGAEYLKTTFQEIGLTFPYREMQATLTVCPGVVTMSSPLLFSVKQYLPSSAVRLPDEHFVEQLYHELMHHYVRQARDASALRKKYETEGQRTLSHLHVVSLEKFVLTQMGKAEELKRVETDYLNSPNPGYPRAWKIVSEEGYEPFLNELKQYARSRN